MQVCESTDIGAREEIGYKNALSPLQKMYDFFFKILNKMLFLSFLAFLPFPVLGIVKKIKLPVKSMLLAPYKIAAVSEDFFFSFFFYIYLLIVMS